MAAPKGNTFAAGKRWWSDAIRKRIIQGEHVDDLADKLIAQALGGDMTALKEIGDRLEGKAVQVTDNTNTTTVKHEPISKEQMSEFIRDFKAEYGSDLPTTH